MVFSTQIFLFGFMPLCLLAYFVFDRLEHLGKAGEFLKKIRLKDIVLIIFSFGFYQWTVMTDLYRLIIFILAVYFIGRCMTAAKKKQKISRAKFIVTAGAVLILLCLIYYKYSMFLLQIWNSVFRTEIVMNTVFAPLGISFIAFSAISYLTDIYRGKAENGSLIDCTLFLCFFPKVVSGPIVLWQDFEKMIGKRRHSMEQITDGLNRIMIGFAKKVLLADVLGECVASIGTTGIDQITAAGSILLYMLQIYYDFAGYSDIAIGLAKLFGFDFKENFNFPYRSKSISEFWRRWHISLGTWFREYVYFPLGGSRVSRFKTLRNLAVVFALTGIWHGAGWNYILWGFINGVIVVVEHMVKDKKFYKKIPDWIKYTFTMVVVLLFWELFRFQSVKDAAVTIGIALGAVSAAPVLYTWKYYFDARIIVFALIGIIGATLFGSERVKKLHQKFISTPAGYFVQEIVLLVIFAATILFIVNSTYSPFIYFQY